MLYSYCQAFNVSPLEAKGTPAKLVIELLQVHSEYKKYEQEELEREIKKRA